jgi:hypothetical protein
LKRHVGLAVDQASGGCQPEGTPLPELVQWLPSAALDKPIGTVGAGTLRETTAIVTALIS